MEVNIGALWSKAISSSKDVISSSKVKSMGAMLGRRGMRAGRMVTGMAVTSERGSKALGWGLGRYASANVYGSLVANSGKEGRAAILGMLGSDWAKGAFQGAAIGAGLNAAATMGSNAYNGRSMTQGVGTAAFRGGLWGGAVGGGVSMVRGAFGVNSKSAEALLKHKAIAPFVGEAQQAGLESIMGAADFLGSSGARYGHDRMNKVMGRLNRLQTSGNTWKKISAARAAAAKAAVAG